MGVILVTILTVLASSGQVLRQEVAGQEVPIGQIIDDVEKQTVKNTLSDTSDSSDSFSIEKMFEVQLAVSKLSQISEMASPVIPALNSELSIPVLGMNG